MEEMKMELLILPTLFTFPTFNRNKVTYKNNVLFRETGKNNFFFSKKLHMYFVSRKLFVAQIVDIMKPDILYATKKLISWELTFQNANRVFNPNSSYTAWQWERKTSEGGARGISARKSAIYVFTRKEAQMKLDAARRIKRRRGYHGIGSLCHLELTPRYAAKWLLPRRRCFSRDAQDWSIRLMRFDNNNDNDGDDEVNNNKERLHHARDA